MKEFPSTQQGQQIYDCMSRNASIHFKLGLVVDSVGHSKNLIAKERVAFYQWKNDAGIQLNRGRALLFHDQNHETYATALALSFRQLRYTTKLHNLHPNVYKKGLYNSITLLSSDKDRGLKSKKTSRGSKTAPFK